MIRKHLITISWILLMAMWCIAPFEMLTAPEQVIVSAQSEEQPAGDISGDTEESEDPAVADDQEEGQDPADPDPGDPENPDPGQDEPDPEPEDPDPEPEENAVKVTIRTYGKRYDVSGGTWYMLSGRTSQLKVTFKPADPEGSVKYKSSNKKIVKVSSAGKITAVKKGKAKIRVTGTCSDGTVIKAYVTVKVISSGFPRTAKYKGTGRWKGPIRSIEKRNASKPQGRVVFYGSSSIRRWKTLRKDMSKLKVLNHGFGGSTVNDCLYYTDRMLVAYHPEAVVFYAGTNDIAFGYSPDTIYTRTVEFFKYVHNRLPDTKIYYVAQTRQPRRAGYWSRMKKLNAKVKKYSAVDPMVTYIDTASAVSEVSKAKRSQYFLKDGLHFTSKGYKAWNSVIRRALYKDLVR